MLSSHVVLRCSELPRCSEFLAIARGVSAMPVALAFCTIFFVCVTADFFVADAGNHRVQQCSSNSTGNCTTVAGTGSGGSDEISLLNPYRVELDSNGDLLIADTSNDRVQLCPAASPGAPCITVGGVDGFGSGAQQLDTPREATVDGDGNYLIADFFNDRVQRCSPVAPFPCSTVAGTGGEGSGLDQLVGPNSVAIDALGDYVIADRLNNRVVQCPAASPGANCTVMASDLYRPRGVSVVASGSYLIADTFNHRVQLCPPSSGSTCETVAGGNGQGSASNQLSYPSMAVVDDNGDYLVADAFEPQGSTVPRGISRRSVYHRRWDGFGRIWCCRVVLSEGSCRELYADNHNQHDHNLDQHDLDVDDYNQHDDVDQLELYVDDHNQHDHNLDKHELDVDDHNQHDHNLDKHELDVDDYNQHDDNVDQLELDGDDHNQHDHNLDKHELDVDDYNQHDDNVDQLELYVDDHNQHDDNVDQLELDGDDDEHNPNDDEYDDHNAHDDSDGHNDDHVDEHNEDELHLDQFALHDDEHNQQDEHIDQNELHIDEHDDNVHQHDHYIHEHPRKNDDDHFHVYGQCNRDLG